MYLYIMLFFYHLFVFFFFFNDTATTEIYTLSLHDALPILLHAVPYWAIVLVAFIEGVGAAFFSVAYTGALRAVVPTRQLPSAAGAQTGRQAAVQLAGPPLGGALFGLARALPFLADAVSYTFSTLSLLAMR